MQRPAIMILAASLSMVLAPGVLWAAAAPAFDAGMRDWDCYTNKVRAARCSFDQGLLRPYFEIGNVLEKSVFFAVGKVYGLSFKERRDLPVYDPDQRWHADAVEWFKENGGLLRKNGDHFRKALLSRGGTVEAMEMYRGFRGRDARIEPFLERRGLSKP